MRLALFDLDFTLLPFDSGMAWTRFLVERGELPPAAEDDYLDCCKAYVAGTLGIDAVHRAIVAPLGRVDAATLDRWRADFEHALRPRAPAGMRRLVRRHLQAGDLCALVTATTRLVAEPCARLFGLPHVVATEPTTADGAFTGAIDGPPCAREHKVTHVARWLADRAPAGAPRDLEGFEESWFYTDSASDLPLLRAVSTPVAVRPDPDLRAHARAAGWAIVDTD